MFLGFLLSESRENDYKIAINSEKNEKRNGGSEMRKQNFEPLKMNLQLFAKEPEDNPDSNGSNEPDNPSDGKEDEDKMRFNS